MYIVTLRSMVDGSTIERSTSLYRLATQLDLYVELCWQVIGVRHAPVTA